MSDEVQQGQVENLTTNVLPPPAQTGAEDATKPRVVFATDLVLTRAQEDALCEHAKARIEQLEGQLGRKIQGPNERGQGAAAMMIADPESFLGKRERYTAHYYNHVGYRKNGASPGSADDTIYNHSNLTASLSQRITRQMIAKAVGFFLGQPDDDDWFTAVGVGVEDEDEADKIKAYSRWKARKCGVKDALMDGMEFCFVRGEVVEKVTHQQRGQIYKKKSTILVAAASQDEAKGAEPILDRWGDYIVLGDPFVPQMSLPAGYPYPGGQPGVVAQPGDATGQMPAPQNVTAPGQTEPGTIFANGAAPQAGNVEARMTNAGGAPAPAPGPVVPSGPTPSPAAPPAGASFNAPSMAVPGNQAADPVPSAAAVGMQPQGPPAAGQASAGAAIPPPPLVPTGKMVLKRDGVTELPDNPVWDERVIARRRITFEGPEVAEVFYMDFLCPLDAKDIQSADLICHLYDMNVMQMAEMVKSGVEDGGVKNLQSAVDQLRGLAAGSAEPKSATSQPRTDFKESDTTGSPNNPRFQVAESWMTYDVDGDGNSEEVMLVMDRATGLPISYDYAANVTTSGLRPFRVIRAIKVSGRWYGMGAMEYFSPEQEAIDLQLNRKNFADAGAGRVTIWNPENTLEGQRDPNLRMRHGGSYTARPGKTAKDIVESVELPNDGEDFEFLLNKYEQYMMLKSGVVNGADQEASDLPTGDTATGVNEVAQSGEEMFSLMIASLYRGVMDTLQCANEVLFANMVEEEVFSYFNGQANQIMTLTPDDVRQLSINVTLSLSRTQEQRQASTAPSADAAINTYYARPPELQERTKDFARNQLRNLRVPGADKIIQPLIPALPVPGQSGVPGNVTPMPAQSAV